MQDVFNPTGQTGDARVGPLHIVTYFTTAGPKLLQTFREGFELEATEWFHPGATERESLNPYLGIPNSLAWQSCRLFRSDAAANVQIRIVHVAEQIPAVRPEVDGRYVGGLSIGFPMHDMLEREQKLSALQIPSSIGKKDLEFTSPTGEVYVSSEIHFLGPENIFLLGVQRPHGFTPVGPLIDSQPIGAAAYSARCVRNADEVIDFFERVLGFETRRDITMQVSERSGLRLKQGTDERFIQLFAPGYGTGYLVLLDHGEETLDSPAPTLGPPSRGVVMWSFATDDLAAVEHAAMAANARILRAPVSLPDPTLDRGRSMMLQDPGGFPIEVIQYDD